MSYLQGIESLPRDIMSEHTMWWCLTKENSTSTGPISDYVNKQKSHFEYYNSSKIN